MIIRQFKIQLLLGYC